MIGYKHKSVRRLLKDRYIYLLLAPALIYFIIFKYIPMYGIIISFQDYSPVRGFFGSEWVGFKHFADFFGSYTFGKIFRNTILISLYKLFWGFPVPIILALMLNEVRFSPFKRVVQTAVYLPHFVSWIVIANLTIVFFSTDSGLITAIVEQLTGYRMNILANEQTFRSVLVASEIWKGAGWNAIIFLAAIAGIDPHLYEAARIDGAKRIQMMRHITVPGITAVMIILFILNLGFILDAGFEQILVMQNPLVTDVSEIIDLHVYRVGLLSAQYSYSTAIGLFKSVTGLILIVLANKLVKKIDKEGLW